MPPVTGPGVVALGTIGDVGDFYRRVRVVVVPVSSGTGIRMKALEALAHGVGVVATPRGAEGLEGCRAVQSRPLTDMPAALGAALDCSAGAQGETARRWIRENHGPVAARSSLQALRDRLAHA
jgi:glycosyltransferase involved in cell wall biosynthesis